MSVYLEYNYSKKIGLPSYSSHQFAVSVRSEVTNPEDIIPETQRVYSLLQSSVDSQIKNTGFLPDQKSNANSNGGNITQFPGNDRQGAVQDSHGASSWSCSPKQRDLILKIIDENQLPAGTEDAIAVELHGKPMVGLTKLEASGVVSEFINRYRRRRNGDTSIQHGRNGQ